MENEKRPPRGGDAPPTGGGWEWTLNWDQIVYDEGGAVAEPTEKQLADAALIIGGGGGASQLNSADP